MKQTPHEELTELGEFLDKTREIVGKSARRAFVRYLREWLKDYERTWVEVVIYEDEDVEGLPRFEVVSDVEPEGTATPELALETELQQYGAVVGEGFEFDTTVRVAKDSVRITNTETGEDEDAD